MGRNGSIWADTYVAADDPNGWNKACGLYLLTKLDKHVYIKTMFVFSQIIFLKVSLDLVRASGQWPNAMGLRSVAERQGPWANGRT